MDSAPSQSADFSEPLVSSQAGERRQEPFRIEQTEATTAEISADIFEELWREAEGDQLGITKAELMQVLSSIGAKYNFGLPPGTAATPAQIEAFYRKLQLRDLALAHACALGYDLAWQQFLARYRNQITQAAVAITGSSSLGQDLADSLYSELFGLTERDGQRRSPFASYSGRGSFMGWLHTTLVQRHVDHHRRTYRETPLDQQDFAATSTAPTPSPETTACLDKALTAALRALEPEERFLLSAWFLDQHTLLEIARVLNVHEATVSRKIKRLTSRLHKDLLRQLEISGMSKRAAEEALGTDPRDLTINLRTLLQTSPPSAFFQQGGGSDTGKA